jgi:uncharacterized membrane protein
MLLLGAGCNREDRSPYPVLQEEGGEVRIDISGIEPDVCSFFSYLSRSGKNVNLIVYRESDGSAGVSLDACRSCYRWRRGYRLEAGKIVCAKCDVAFPIDGLREGTGSCVPVRVPASVEGNTLVISSSFLEEGARYF